jgi:hypothetical protein
MNSCLSLRTGPQFMYCLRGFLSALVCVGVTFSGVTAAPPLVERTPPRKEPVYQGTPLYCLFVIGPEATPHWLVLDGDRVYLDRNANGDLTDKENRIEAAPRGVTDGKAPPGLGKAGQKGPGPNVPGFFTLGTLRGSTGRAPFSNLLFELSTSGDRKDFAFSLWTDDPKVLPKIGSPLGIRNAVSVQMGSRLEIRRTDPQPRRTPAQVYARVASGVLARRPADAPVIWFDGPLAVRLAIPDETFLVRGEKTAHLSVTVGTFVSEKGSRVLTLQEIPDRVHPVADVEFPSEGSRKPIRARFVLNERC